MRNRKRIDYAKNLEKLTREDPSLSDSQLSIHNPNNMNLAQALIASESVGSLINLGHGQGQANGSLIAHKREQQQEDMLRKGSMKQQAVGLLGGQGSKSSLTLKQQQ
jgi:hypothetical protein